MRKSSVGLAWERRVRAARDVGGFMALAHEAGVRTGAGAATWAWDFGRMSSREFAALRRRWHDERERERMEESILDGMPTGREVRGFEGARNLDDILDRLDELEGKGKREIPGDWGETEDVDEVRDRVIQEFHAGFEQGYMDAALREADEQFHDADDDELGDDA